MASIFLDTLQGKPQSRPPVWYMRQAGRVLPSYLKIKEKYTFWQLMKNPELAAEVTLLPVHDLGVDAAILFSDILVIPYALGMGLDFTETGPVFEEPLKHFDHPEKKMHPRPEKLEYIYRVIDQIRKIRPENTPLIGFCGAPLTVISYMLQGLGSRSDFTDAVKWMFSHEDKLPALVDAVTEITLVYIKNQIRHGIDAFQLFETHAGLIPNRMYEKIFLPSVEKIAAAVREEGVPFIFFPKGIGDGLHMITPQHADFISVDWLTPLERARKVLDKAIGLQGNLDPRLLFSDKKTIEKELEKYLVFGREHKNWIFNLGHGFLPGTPFENARFVTDWVKEQKWE
jgi:uroporphyrinogen decarboxylase